MKARFVDGGYFENSGLDTIADLIEELRVLNLGDTVVFRVLTFDFPITELNPKRSYGLGEVASPIRALNSARSARIDSARNRIKDMQGALWVDLISISLDDKLTEFPLGWTLSKYTFHRMDCDLYSELACASIGRNLYSGADAEPNSVARENRRRLNLIVTEIDNPTLMTQAVLTHSDLPEQLKARR